MTAACRTRLLVGTAVEEHRGALFAESPVHLTRFGRSGDGKPTESSTSQMAKRDVPPTSSSRETSDSCWDRIVPLERFDRSLVSGTGRRIDRWVDG
jgi:hypothetical protein